MSAVPVRPRPTRPSRAHSRWPKAVVAGLSALAVGALVSAGPAATPPAAAATGHVYYVGPGSDADGRLERAMASLRPGDTLRIQPGTYGVDLRPDTRLSKGTASAPITITAADPAHRPLLVGAVKFDQPTYWVIDHLRVQGTIPNRDSFTINSGTGWRVTNTEVFGAAQTGAYANVVIAKYQGWSMPQKFVFAENCVHDGGHVDARRGQLHEIYVTAVGDSANSLIARNTLYNTPYGAAIKLGDGGIANAPGVDNVQVSNNTMWNNGIQILLFARTTGNKIRGNLFVKSTRTLTNGRDTTGFYLLNVVRGSSGTYPNMIEQNYFASTTFPIFDNRSAPGVLVNRGDNNAYAGIAGITTGGCEGLQPGDAHAKYYGRYTSRSLYVAP